MFSSVSQFDLVEVTDYLCEDVAETVGSFLDYRDFARLECVSKVIQDSMFLHMDGWNQAFEKFFSQQYHWVSDSEFLKRTETAVSREVQRLNPSDTGFMVFSEYSRMETEPLCLARSLHDNSYVGWKSLLRLCVKVSCLQEDIKTLAMDKRTARQRLISLRMQKPITPRKQMQIEQCCATLRSANNNSSNPMADTTALLKQQLAETICTFYRKTRSYYKNRPSTDNKHLLSPFMSPLIKVGRHQHTDHNHTPILGRIDYSEAEEEANAPAEPQQPANFEIINLNSEIKLEADLDKENIFPVIRPDITNTNYSKNTDTYTNNSAKHALRNRADSTPSEFTTPQKGARPSGEEREREEDLLTPLVAVTASNNKEIEKEREPPASWNNNKRSPLRTLLSGRF